MAFARGIAFGLSGCAAVALLWHVVALSIRNEALLPGLGAIGGAFAAIGIEAMAADVANSLFHLAIGYSLGVSLGLSLAVLHWTAPVARDAVDWTIELLRPISGIAWIPLAIMIFGVGPAIPVFLVAYVSCFPVFVATVAGMKSADSRLIDAAKVLGAGRWMLIRTTLIPLAAPHLIAGLRLALGVAWVTVIAAELMGGDTGLGWRSFWHQQFFAMPKTLAVIVVIGAIGAALDAGMGFAQRRVLAVAAPNQAFGR